MKRRNFVKGILGLTGLAASGASVAIEPVSAGLSEKTIANLGSGFLPAGFKKKGSAVITPSNMPRLLQEGVKSVFADKYKSHESKWQDTFS